MPDISPYQTPYPIDFAITELRELQRGNREHLLMQTVFNLLVDAVVALSEQITELEKQNAQSLSP